MKKTYILLLLVLLLLWTTLAACAGTPQDASSDTTASPSTPVTSPSTSPTPSASPDAVSPSPTPEPDTHILVAYFSATGHTADIAAQLQTILGADLYEIIPEIPYTEEDLAYNNDDCRANQEQNDPDARPAIASEPVDMTAYDTIFLGYPIWWGQAPKIISTFLEQYDLSGKTIIPFCTSGSSGIGSSASNLQGLAPEATWLAGQRFAAGTPAEDIAAWTETLGLDA